MISDKLLVKCPWCLSETQLKTWDDLTFKSCITRETRRAFRSLTNEKVWKKDSKNFYQCPNCSQWSRGNKLRIVNPENEDQKNLGGEALFEISDS